LNNTLGQVGNNDWVGWHDAYDRPGSHLARRLGVVQSRIRDALDAMPAGPIRVISMCAGQGRDLIGALQGHPRRGDVTARLVEADPANAEAATTAAGAAGLPAVEVVCGDASTTSAYAGAVPADLVLACGIFGNVSDDDVARTVNRLPVLCAPGATVIWTRHRKEPDLTVDIREWFADAGFGEIAFDGPDDVKFGVGTHRLERPPEPFEPGVTMFRFVADDGG
jgi:hypothetical protein